MENTKFPGKLAIAAAQHSKERKYWFTKMSGNPVKSYFYYDYNKFKVPGKNHMHDQIADKPLLAFQFIIQHDKI